MHLYLHIPFCRQACHYCDFHFSTSLKQKQDMVKAITTEIVQRKDYLPHPQLDTIYFGGGTPSLLTQDEIKLIMETISGHFSVSPDAEITLEANPDDLTKEKVKELAQAGINRLSIGIQSFNPEHLTYLNRVHSAQEAENCVKTAQDAGITTLSIDLIYAIPAKDHSILLTDIQKAVSLDVAHISAYCLTIEPQTVFGKWLKNKKIKAIEDEYAAEQFGLVTRQLAENGYEQYEISNFARNQQYSKHNTAYWQRRPYLGVGPSAHSYNGTSRQYAISNNSLYLQAIQKGESPCTVEKLTDADHVNEYLLTGLRTKWGCELDLLEQLSNFQFLKINRDLINDLTNKSWIRILDNTLVLTEAGKLFADRITSELFID